MARKSRSKPRVRAEDTPFATRGNQVPPGATKKVSDADLRPGEPPSTFDDRYAAGTPGGGSEYGGLAGRNYGDGDPDVPELQEAMGNGDHIAGDDDMEDEVIAGVDNTASNVVPTIDDTAGEIMARKDDTEGEAHAQD